MKRSVNLFSVCAAAVLISGCSTVPIIGRKQAALVPESQMISQSALSYREVLAESTLSTDVRQAAQVQAVGKRIAAAVDTFLREHGEGERVAAFQWEFNLIDDDTPNAWCMPGGKVMFYTGILPYTQDEAGLAVVMGHEVAHAVARHGCERVSHQMLQQGGGYFTSLFSKNTDYHEAIMQVYGIGSQYIGILPYSRLHENEADRLGLIFMAMAGYDPNAAIGFWQRMAASNPNAPPELLSTHPSDDTRIRKLREYMPEAMQYYRE